MRRKLLELLGFPVKEIEFEINRSLEEITELQEWASSAKARLLRLQQKLEMNNDSIY